MLRSRADSTQKFVYEGEYKRVGFGSSKIFHGRGKCVFTDGAIYDGEWRDGSIWGRGCMKWSDGRHYDGEWVDNKCEGKGSLTFHDGGRYEGIFKADAMHGEGIYYFTDGQQFEGVWVKNEHPREGTWTDEHKMTFDIRLQANASLYDAAEVGDSVFEMKSKNKVQLEREEREREAEAQRLAALHRQRLEEEIKELLQKYGLESVKDTLARTLVNEFGVRTMEDVKLITSEDLSPLKLTLIEKKKFVQFLDSFKPQQQSPESASSTLTSNESPESTASRKRARSPEIVSQQYTHQEHPQQNTQQHSDQKTQGPSHMIKFREAKRRWLSAAKDAFSAVGGIIYDRLSVPKRAKRCSTPNPSTSNPPSESAPPPQAPPTTQSVDTISQVRDTSVPQMAAAAADDGEKDDASLSRHVDMPCEDEVVSEEVENADSILGKADDVVDKADIVIEKVDANVDKEGINVEKGDADEEKGDDVMEKGEAIIVKEADAIMDGGDAIMEMKGIIVKKEHDVAEGVDEHVAGDDRCYFVIDLTSADG